jgi:hypothetical protein
MTDRCRIGRHYLALFVCLCVSLALALSGCQMNATTLPSIVYMTDSSESKGYALQTGSDIILAGGEPDKDQVELVGVGLAAEGAYIAVYFRSPPAVVGDWWQGSVYIIDETTNQIFSDVPVMPVIGPLIAKPKEAGQLGYFMLINTGQAINENSHMTVVLGKYKRVGVKMQ